jgi:hypothetical protein
MIMNASTKILRGGIALFVCLAFFMNPLIHSGLAAPLADADNIRAISSSDTSGGSFDVSQVFSTPAPDPQTNSSITAYPGWQAVSQTTWEDEDGSNVKLNSDVIQSAPTDGSGPTWIEASGAYRLGISYVTASSLLDFAWQYGSLAWVLKNTTNHSLSNLYLQYMVFSDDSSQSKIHVSYKVGQEVTLLDTSGWVDVTDKVHQDGGSLAIDDLGVTVPSGASLILRWRAGEDASGSYFGIDAVHLMGSAQMQGSAIQALDSSNAALATSPAVALHPGDVLKLAATYPQAVSVTGTPTLPVTFGSGASTHTVNVPYVSKVPGNANQLLFQYTLQAADLDSDGIQVGAQIQLANGAAITESDANLDGVSLDFTGRVSLPAIKVTDSTPPTLQSITATAKTYRYNDKIDFSVVWSEDVTVTGTPTLTLNVGGQTRSAGYNAGSSTARNLVFTYTVGLGDQDTDGIAVSALSVGGAAIKDNDENLADGTLPASLDFSAVRVDAHPYRTSIAATTMYAHLGQTFQLLIPYDHNVTVTGSPKLNITIGGKTRSAIYNREASNSNTLYFDYTVQAGDQTDDHGVGLTTLDLNGATIADAGGFSVPETIGDAILSEFLWVDGVAPHINNIRLSNGIFRAGQTITITLTWNEEVYWTDHDTPGLILQVGGVQRSAGFTEINVSRTATTFTYTVQSGDTDANGLEVTAVTVSNGGHLQDSMGNQMEDPFPGAEISGEARVDTTKPAVVSILGPQGGTYPIGQDLAFDVKWDEALTLTDGTSGPCLTVTVGSQSRCARYDSQPADDTLTFVYPVAAGDADSDGVVISGLSLGDGNIQDAAGNSTQLSVSSPADLQSVKVDGVAPQISGVSVPANGTYGVGQVLTFGVSWDEAVSLGNGTTPGLTVGIGSYLVSAAYVPAHSTSTRMEFAYTIRTDDIDSDGITISGLTLSSGGTLRDAAGNTASLTLHQVDPSGGVRVDAQRPPVASVDVPADGVYGLGQTLDFVVHWTKAITVSGSGTPRLGMLVGSQTRYADLVSGSGSTTLTFQLTVQAEDRGGLDIFPYVDVNGASMNDAYGNPAVVSLSFAEMRISLDGRRPAITQHTPGADETDVAVDASVQLTFSMPVTLSADWVRVACSISGPHAATITHQDETYTIHPTVDFANGEICMVQVDQDAVQNSLGIHPAEDIYWRFITHIATPAPVLDLPGDTDEPVKPDSAFTITFPTPVSFLTPSEAAPAIRLAASSDWLTIQCSVSGVHDYTTTLSADERTYTIQPVTEFLNGETCTATVHADRVVARDTGARVLAADLVQTFETLAEYRVYLPLVVR